MLFIHGPALTFLTLHKFTVVRCITQSQSVTRRCSRQNLASRLHLSILLRIVRKYILFGQHCTRVLEIIKFAQVYKATDPLGRTAFQVKSTQRQHQCFSGPCGKEKRKRHKVIFSSWLCWWTFIRFAKMSSNAGQNQHSYATRSKDTPAPSTAESQSNEYSPTDATPTKAVNTIPKKNHPKRNDVAAGKTVGSWKRKIHI